MVPLPLGLVPEFEARLERAWCDRRKSVAVRRDALAIGLGMVGLRWIEVERLKRSQSLVVASCEVAVKTAKGGRDRRILLGPSWMAAMEEVLQIQIQAANARSECLLSRWSGGLFQTRDGKPLPYEQVRRRSRQWTFRVFRQPFTFHCFRHTAALRLYLATRDVLAVQHMLGHRSLQHTQEYLTTLQLASTAGAASFVDRKPGLNLRIFDPDSIERKEA